MNQFISPLTSTKAWFHPVNFDQGEEISLKECPTGEKKFIAHFGPKVVEIELHTFNPIKRTIEGTYTIEGVQDKVICRVYTEKKQEGRDFYTIQPKGSFARQTWGISFLKI